MSGVCGKWIVRRYEQPLHQDYSVERQSLSPEGYATVCDTWRKACEAITLAIGPNCLQFGVEAKEPVVFERDGVVVIAYHELRID